MCRKSVSELRVMHGHPEDKPKLYSLWVMSVASSRFLAIYQWQFCIHTYWLVPPTEQVHLWMVIVVKCTETEMSTFYLTNCLPHPWVWLESQCWYIYIYLYLSQVNEVCREMCKHEDGIPFQLHVVHARRLVMEHYIWQERNLKALWYSPTPMQAHTDFGYTHERTVGLHGDMANLVICVPFWFVV